MKTIMTLAMVAVAGMLITTGCSTCCEKKAACDGGCCKDQATCAKCCTDAAGCAKCCKK